MINAVEIIVIIFCITGALAISGIESRAISKRGPLVFGGNSLRRAYWSELTRIERVIFWIGCILVLSPFALLML